MWDRIRGSRSESKRHLAGLISRPATAGESPAARGRAGRSAVTDFRHLAAAFKCDGPSPARLIRFPCSPIPAPPMRRLTR